VVPGSQGTDLLDGLMGLGFGRICRARGEEWNSSITARVNALRPIPINTALMLTVIALLTVAAVLLTLFVVGGVIAYRAVALWRKHVPPLIKYW
jgi:hypothetical protein